MKVVVHSIPLLITLHLRQFCNIGAVQFSSDAVIEFPSLNNAGQQQLKSLEAKANAPTFGECWSRAVTNLKVGCRSLTEELQSALALRLTDCFLQSSGHGPIFCDVPRKECLQQISDRAFNAYTEFYTHTQSICYFLQSKVWQEETEKTIDRLSSTSQKVISQLADAEKGQNDLLQRQRESINLQETVALNLAASKQTIKLLMDDLKISAEEQKAGLMTLFEQLAALQSWIVGEVSWIDSLLFYSASSLAAFLLTSTPKTQAARLFLFVLLSLNYFIERYLGSVNNKEMYLSSIFKFNDDLRHWVWLCRKVSIALSLSILFLCYFTYRDYTILNHNLLYEIKKQNDVIINWVQRKKHLENSQSPQTFHNNDPIPLHFPIDVDMQSKTPQSFHYSINKVSQTPLLGVRAPLHNPRLKKLRNEIVDVESKAFSDTGSETSEHSVRRSARIRRLVR